MRSKKMGYKAYVREESPLFRTLAKVEAIEAFKKKGLIPPDISQCSVRFDPMDREPIYNNALVKMVSGSTAFDANHNVLGIIGMDLFVIGYKIAAIVEAEIPVAGPADLGYSFLSPNSEMKYIL